MPSADRPSTTPFWSCPSVWPQRVLRRSPSNGAPTRLLPNPCRPGVGFVLIAGHENFCYGSLLRGRRSQEESREHPGWVHHERHLEPVDPLRLGGAASERCLSAEQPFARSSHPHDRWDEGRVQDVVDDRGLGELFGAGSLQEAQLGLQGSDASVELALGAEGREVGAQVRRSEAPEVSLAARARPLRQDRQGKNLALGKESGTTGLARRTRRVVGLPPFVYVDVQ